MTKPDPFATALLRDKTILQIIPRLESGGAERTTVDMCDGIMRAGGQALVASAGGRLVPEVEEAGAAHFKLPLDAKLRVDQHYRNFRAVRRICEENSVDLIHVRSRAPAFAGLRAARRLKIPFLTTYHGIYSEKSALKRWYNSVMVKGEAVIANSHYTRDIIVERYGVSQDKIPVVHRGTDLNRFNPASINPDATRRLRESWGVPEGRPVVLLLARLTAWKGHFHAIDAAEMAKKEEGIRPFFVFSGSTQSETYAARVRSAVLDRGLFDDVAVVGHSDDVPLALSVADLVIVPSTKPEAFGRSVAEASAMGLPVIAFDHGGVVETIATPPTVPEEERTGFRVPVADSPALYETIKTVFAMTAEARHAMGARGRARVARHFSREQMVKDTLFVYHSIMTR